MLSEHPAKFWVKYLILLGKSVEDITALVRTADLDIAIDQVECIRDSFLKLPDLPLKPEKNKNADNYLREEGVYEAWYRDSEYNKAEKLLTSPARGLIETFLLSPIRYTLAAKKIRQKFDIVISEEAYELFRHYFWNTKLLNGAEWGAFISRRSAAHKEWMSLAMGSKGIEGSKMLLWKMGFKNKFDLDAGTIFSEMRDMSFMCFLQAANDAPSVEHSAMLRNYAQIAKMCQEQVDITSSAMSDIVSSFSNFKMQLEETNIMPVCKLTKGNVSIAEEHTREKLFSDEDIEE